MSATIPELLVLLENPDTLPVLEAINANGNDLLCYRPHPAVSRAEEQLGFVILNVIDDTARSPH